MARPSYFAFRDGEPLELDGGGTLTHSELADAGLAEHYLRIAHALATGGQLDRATVDDWLERLRDPKGAARLKTELRGRAPTPLAPRGTASASETGATGSGKGSAKRGRGRGRSYTLISRADHKRAAKIAREEELTPVPASSTAKAGAAADDAWVVTAPKKLASRLISSGFWTTALDD